MLHAETVRQWLQVAFPGATVIVKGDDGRHFSAKIVSEQFQDMPMLAQHRLVYQALGDKMHSEIHALSLETYAVDTQSDQ